ncbi:glycosyltransferase family 4 protein [Arthrobacter sp. AQ5-05]|uniref:glycosyltransferase family 4 protein n=1 Tax=Arthrobacter sp. AQ5-05 TaxID=2184581 RepID=UPI001E49748E|nr:glycosyltransferase family 4 protein [Arthrobacter sp. AQ5-05]
MLLIHSYWPEHSPPQRRWSTLIREFRAVSWDVDVVTPVAHFPLGRRELPIKLAGSPFRGQRGPHGERIKRVPFIPHSGNFHAARLLDQVFSAGMSIPAGLMWRKADVIIVTAPSLPILIAGYIVAKLRGVPLIVEMRDAWPDLARDARIVKGNVKSLIERVVEAIQMRADLVVAVTEGFAKTLRDRGVQNVATVSNGLDVDAVPSFAPPALDRDVLEALYLGNHGESQRLDVIIRASALVGDAMHLHMVGHGTKRPDLVKLAAELGAPVTFHPSLHGMDVRDRYESADTCIVSLRDDWKSFEATVPSKTYEVLAIGRHVTAIVRGEAARIVTDADGGDVVTWNAEAIASLWRELANDRKRLHAGTSGREWVEKHANYPVLASEYMTLISALVLEKSRVR